MFDIKELDGNPIYCFWKLLILVKIASNRKQALSLINQFKTILDLSCLIRGLFHKLINIHDYVSC